MAKKVEMSSVLKRLGEEEVVLIDVLDPELYKKIHLKGAINIPIDRLEEEVGERVDPETPVITVGIDLESPVCKIAAEKLEQMGYRDVSYYPGGRQEWIEAQMPVERQE